jgi:hypothetical protein
VEQELPPVLRPGQTVLLDNLSVRDSPRARRLVASAGCALRFLPHSSPDLTPIEPAFAKVKGALRKAEPRSFDALVAAAGPAITGVTAAAHVFFTAAGNALPDNSNEHRSKWPVRQVLDGSTAPRLQPASAGLSGSARRLQLRATQTPRLASRDGLSDRTI